MDRRRFMKDAAQAGMTVGVTRSLLGGATRAGQSEQNSVKKPDLKGEALAKAKSGRSLVVGTPILPLDGEWLLVTDPRNVGRSEGWFGQPVPGGKPARVPGVIQEAFPAYHGVVWYQRDFVAPIHEHKAGRYLLRFWQVDYLADVWLNSTRVGGHEGAETPFTLDVTEVIKPGASNHLAVRVLNPGNEPIDGIVLKEIPHKNKAVPFNPGNTYDYGGILESVELLLSPAVRVKDLFVRPDPKTGKVRLQVRVHNTTGKTTRGQLEITMGPAANGETILTKNVAKELAAGETLIETETRVENPRLWGLEDPYLYRVTTRLQTEGSDSVDERSVRCGFRDFRVVNGYFRLNGKRIFLRSTHGGNLVPIGTVVPPLQAPDLLRRDFLYAKACGFNCIRFCSGGSHPANMDLCDEIGLLFYQEPLASWLLGDSPKMKERYESSLREVVIRDRNHPSVVIWGMMNETSEGPVFREAVSALPLLRSLDDTRLVLLSSGRFDGDLSIGSLCNPGSTQWEYEWGKEAPGAPHMADWKVAGHPSVLGVGDFHFYPKAPQTPEVNHFLRNLGEDGKPVFLSEYGMGSMVDVIHEAAMYEQVGAAADLEDFVLLRSMADKLKADWKRFGMEGAYAFPEDFLRDSQRRMARHRLLGFNLLRSNPKLCGYNLTGMLDHSMVGEGVWRFWRDWKPGAMDAMQDGWWPLHWCLFAEPTHSYAGRPFQVEAVLATEDVLRGGEYPARFRFCGPTGIAWERTASVRIPRVAVGEDGPLAVPVLKEEVTLNAPAGSYDLVANLEEGGAPLGRTWQIYLSDPASLPQLSQTVTVWGMGDKAETWLKAHGVTCEPWGGTAPSRREVILVGDLSKAGADAAGWKELARRMARGSVAVFLSQQAFQREKDAVAWLPRAQKGRCYRFNDWLYHKECVAKVHPVFEGLQGGGILDWYYYGPVVPHYLFDGQETPSEVISAAFAAGYSTPGGYASGILLGRYGLGEGQFILNTFPVLDHIDEHPAADRLLLNLVKYAGTFAEKPLAGLPADFDDQLRAIGYSQ